MLVSIDLVETRIGAIHAIYANLIRVATEQIANLAVQGIVKDEEIKQLKAQLEEKKNLSSSTPSGS